MWGLGQRFLFFFLLMIAQMFYYHLTERLFLLHWIVFVLLLKLVGSYLCGSVSLSSVLFHCSLCQSSARTGTSWLLQLHRKPSHRQSDSPPSPPFILDQDCRRYSRPTPFHVTFSISPSVSTKIFAGIFIGISLNTKVYLRNNPPMWSSQTLSWGSNGVWEGPALTV